MKDNPDRWQRLKDVFRDVSELAPESRPAFLSELRLNEKTLFEELSELLDAEKESEEFLQKPLVFDSDYSLIGETIGHYKIVREIGRGGMGAVFEAIREDGEFDQKAAIKLTNHNLFSDELIKRFRTEKQILAKLEHANIVRLLDGGISANHIPYFVMEFVEGEPITDFCSKNNLSIKERLMLFLQVCEAVLYAHRQLVVHRDLKPSNILVTTNRQVKLLDFGIAKILDSDLQTLTANAPLTPEYASPEQIKGEIITTASDIYSLGVILFELLTEKTPSEIYGVEHSDLLRGVCESEPIRPSSAVSFRFQVSGFKSKNKTSQTAEQRTTNDAQKTNPKSKIQNPKLLRGDLDNIVLKSLQKEKSERYGSVEQFADDVKAYLQGLPVKAHPQSFGYRARKFVKRNRFAVSIAAVAVLLILTVASVAVWQSFVARHQRQIAEQNFNQVRKIANSLILDYHDEIAKLEGSTKLREKLVVDAVNYLDAISAEETDNAELLKEIAVAYRKIGTVQGMPYAANLGKTDEALKNHEKSISLLEKALLIEPANLSLKDELVKSYSEMAQVFGRTAKNSYQIYKKAVEINDESIRLDEGNQERKIYGLRLKILLTDASYDDSLERIDDFKKIVNDAEALFPQQPDNINLVAILALASERIGNIYRWEGRNRQAEGSPEIAKNVFEQSAEFSRKSLQYMMRRQKLEPNDGNNRRRLFVANLNLSSVLAYLKQLDEAEKYQQTAAEIVEQSKRNDPNNKETTLDELAVLKNKFEISIFRGQTDSAFQITTKAIEIAESYEKISPDNSEALTWVGYFYNQQLIILKNQGKDTTTHQRILENIKNKYIERFKSEPSFSGIGLG